MFTDASLPAAVFNGAELVDASFDGATLTNAKFDSAYLRIAGNTFSVRVEVTSNTLPIPTFGLSNTAAYNQTHTPLNTGSSTSVNLGFYYKQCTP